MGDGELLTVSEFAKYTRTTNDALRYYDKMGLVSPISRGKNRYRYYTYKQISSINLIRVAQKLGMTLDEIKDLMGRRNPEFMDGFCEYQIDNIDEKIEELIRARKLLFAFQRSIRTALAADREKITVQFLPAEAIVLGDLNDYSRGRTDYDALYSFYDAAIKKYPHVDINHPVWGVFSEERIKQGDWVWPDKFYFFNPDGYDKRPAAQYAIGYTYCGYGESNDLFKRMIEYIDQNGFEICGDAYKEYLLNEFCIADDNKYLARVMITVQKKTTRAKRKQPPRQ